MEEIQTSSLCTSPYRYVNHGCNLLCFPTLAQFINAYPKGRFYVTRSGHAFAIIDGVVHDNVRSTGPRSRITKAFKVV